MGRDGAVYVGHTSLGAGSMALARNVMVIRSLAGHPRFRLLSHTSRWNLTILPASECRLPVANRCHGQHDGLGRRTYYFSYRRTSRTIATHVRRTGGRASILADAHNFGDR